MKENTAIYQYNDNLLFSVETPIELDFSATDKRMVHFLCPIHRIRLTNVGIPRKSEGYRLMCPICEKEEGYIPVQSSKFTLRSLEEKALAMYDKDLYRDANLIRLDDYYTPEIKKFDALPNSTNYSIKADVKTDKDGDTIVVLYVGYKGYKEKSQIFIKPEKLQLSSDHKDLDPAKVLAKIELTLKDRNISQKYQDKQ